MDEVERLREALRKIAAFGDPYEIAEDPEEWGGPDDALETVCMAYENIQGIARAALAKDRLSALPGSEK
jgi:hypothetical protein